MLAVFPGKSLLPLVPVVRVSESPPLGLKILRLGIVVGPVILEARLREEVRVGLSTLEGEYSDRSAHPFYKRSLCDHDDETFDTLLPGLG